MNKFEWRDYLVSAYEVDKYKVAEVIEVVMDAPEKHHEALMRVGANMLEGKSHVWTVIELLSAVVSELVESEETA